MPERSQASVALGRAVRDLRKRLRLSQEELGFDSGLHRTYVGGIERGERNPSWKNIVKLARALSVEPAELVKLAQEYGPLDVE